MVFVWYNLETEIITRTIHCTHSIICEFPVIRIFVNHWHTWKRNSSFRILYFFFFFKWTFKLCSSLKTRKPSRNNEVKGYESKLALSFEFCQSSSEVWLSEWSLYIVAHVFGFDDMIASRSVQPNDDSSENPAEDQENIGKTLLKILTKYKVRC